MMVYVHGGDAEPNGPNRRPTRVLSDSSKVMGFESSESETANERMRPSSSEKGFEERKEAEAFVSLNMDENESDHEAHSSAGSEIGSSVV